MLASRDGPAAASYRVRFAGKCPFGDLGGSAGQIATLSLTLFSRASIKGILGRHCRVLPAWAAGQGMTPKLHLEEAI